MARLSNLDVVKLADAFPYTTDDPADERNGPLHPAKLYTLVHRTGTDTGSDTSDAAIGYLLPEIVRALVAVPESIRGPMAVDERARTVRVFDGATEAERSATVARLLAHWRRHETWPVLAGWRDELLPVYGGDDEVLYSAERSGLGLLGAMRYGVHMTGYVRDDGARHGIKIWVPRRSPAKPTYPNALDNTVAGGLTTDEDPFEAMAREGDEEASLPERLLRDGLQLTGTVTYIYVTNSEDGQQGLIYPETQWVYDIELPATVIPTPKDGEVACFYLWSVEEVQEALAKGEFKPNCGLVLVDFFVRHGILRREEEPAYDEILRRMHRTLPFPGPHRK